MAGFISRVKIRDRGAASDDDRARFSSSICPNGRAGRGAEKHWRRVHKCGLVDQEKSIDTGGGHRRECRIDLLRTAGVGSNQLEPEGARGVVQHLGMATPSWVERVAKHARPE